MVTGRWGKPTEVLLDLVAEESGNVRGVANPGRQNAPIREGHFDAATGALTLAGEHRSADGTTVPFRVEGNLHGRTLRLTYQYGEMRGDTEVVRVEEYTPPRLTLWERVRPLLQDLKRRFNARSRPRGDANARALRERGESVESIVEGELSKIYLRWEYHGLGLGRKMMVATARRFLERGIHSFILFAELSNPTLGFYDRMGGERLRDDRGRFTGAYGWRDVTAVISRADRS